MFYVSSPELHVRKLYYNGVNWSGTDLTAATNSPPVMVFAYGQSQRLTGFFDGTFEHVFYEAPVGVCKSCTTVLGRGSVRTSRRLPTSSNTKPS